MKRTRNGPKVLLRKILWTSPLRTSYLDPKTLLKMADADMTSAEEAPVAKKQKTREAEELL